VSFLTTCSEEVTQLFEEAGFIVQSLEYVDKEVQNKKLNLVMQRKLMLPLFIFISLSRQVSTRKVLCKLKNKL